MEVYIPGHCKNCLTFESEYTCHTEDSESVSFTLAGLPSITLLISATGACLTTWTVREVCLDAVSFLALATCSV